ncbi:hypothetical protein O7634_22280 [Micromonospora sp. WMMD1120]|uniref:hypothetical protein n=1 Tax=Micromonospora sp. WMMD1120 TaxID=3016106 RepID=UPI0024174675|nr:hypothetical protein [Micromonospora sp. WMMD1120]MDG4809484.1 hypothetical protein [Micromonospora sp. WMMD1120]
MTAIGLRSRRRGVPLHSERHGATAVISHPLDQPLDLWRLLRAEAPPDVLVVPSPRALGEPGCAALLRAVVQGAADVSGTRRVWVAADRVGRPDEAFAPWLSDLAARTGVELLAPDGPVVAVPGGTWYAAGGTGAWGWRSFRRGVGCPVSANRCPTPAWEPALPDRPTTLGRLVADPVPAGLLLRAATAVPAATGDPAYQVPVDPRGPVLVLRHTGRPPVSPADVAALFAGLPAHFPVRVETALLDPSDAAPEPAWFDALAALLGDARLPEPAAAEPVWDTVPVIRDGWCRTGARLYRHHTVPGLLAEVVPMGVLLRRDGGYASPDLAFVDPAAGRLVLGSETSPAMLAAVRQAGGSLGQAVPDDLTTASAAAETAPQRARPSWARSESVTLTLPLPPRPASPPVPVVEATIPPEPPTPPPIPATAPVPTLVVADPASPDTPASRLVVAEAAPAESPEPPAAATAPPVPAPSATVADPVPPPRPVADAPEAAAEPSVSEPAPPLGLAGIGPIPTVRTISGPDVAEPPSSDEDRRWVPASAVPVVDRPSTLEEQNALATALGTAFHDSITTVNAALAAWPALRQEIAVAEKSDLVAVRAFLGHSETSAAEVNAAVRAGQAPGTPGYLPCLVSGLRRLPPCRRAVLGQGRLGVPARRLYPEGTTLVEPAFRSVSARTDVAVKDADVDFVVWSRTARQLGVLAESSDLDEAVFLAGSRFKVLAIRDDPSADRSALPATAVLLRELLPGDTGSGRGLDDDDRAALRRLDRALDRRRAAAPRMVTDARTADRLAGPPLGFVERNLTANASS